MKYLVLGGQGAVGDVRGEVGVVDGAEGETVGPAAAEIGDVDILHGHMRQVMRAARDNQGDELLRPRGGKMQMKTSNVIE